MNVTAFAKWTGTLLLLLTLGACGGSGDGDGGGGGGGGGAPPGSAVIGPAGGTVIGPNGASVVIPPGALAANTTISIAQTSAGLPTLPAGIVPFGPMFAFTPHGTSFAVPVTITLPFDPAAVPAGGAPVSYKTNPAMTGWAEVAGATISGATITVPVTSFSGLLAASKPPLEKVGPAERNWLVFDYTPEGQVIDPLFDEGIQTGGVVDRPYDFGVGTMLDPSAPVPDLLPREFRAKGRVFSSAGGGSYSVSAEAPTPITRALDSRIGNLVVLNQEQTYIKHAENARLRMKVTQLRLEAFDDAGVDLALCTLPAADPANALCDGPMEANIIFFVSAGFEPSQFPAENNFFLGAGLATLQGWRKHWKLTTPPAFQDRQTLWLENKFTIDDKVDGDDKHAKLVLKEPLTIEVDISRVVKENKFKLRVQANAFVQNKRRNEFAYLGAFFRDPTRIDGDVEIITEGLELVDTPADPPPPMIRACRRAAFPARRPER